MPIVTNGPGWTPQLLDTPVADALDANYYVVSSMAPLSVQSEGVQKFLGRLQGRVPEGHAVLERLAVRATRARRSPTRRSTKACENKDLTRKGVLDALHSLTALDTGGDRRRARSTSATRRRLRATSSTSPR